MKSPDAVPSAPPTSDHQIARTSTERWFDLSFRRILPWHIEGIRVDCGTLDEALPFMARFYPELFGISEDDHRWVDDPMTPGKRRFLEDSDFFIFRDGDHVVGLLVGQPTDWKRYYIRTLSLLPDYRGRPFVQALFGRIGDALREVGVAELEGDVSPINIANIITQTRLGGVVTGANSSVRWGSVLRFTVFLDPTADATFRRQFCAGSWAPSRHNISTTSHSTGEERS